MLVDAVGFFTAAGAGADANFFAGAIEPAIDGAGVSFGVLSFGAAFIGVLAALGASFFGAVCGTGAAAGFFTGWSFSAAVAGLAADEIGFVG